MLLGGITKKQPTLTMNMIKKAIRKFVHYVKVATLCTLGAGAAAFIVYSGFVIYQHEKISNKVEAEEPTVEAPAVEDIIIEDVKAIIPKRGTVEQARDMLAEATAQLDAEEQKILDEIEALTADYEMAVATREEKIEQINEVRSSF